MIRPTTIDTIADRAARAAGEAADPRHHVSTVRRCDSPRKRQTFAAGRDAGAHRAATPYPSARPGPRSHAHGALPKPDLRPGLRSHAHGALPKPDLLRGPSHGSLPKPGPRAHAHGSLAPPSLHIRTLEPLHASQERADAHRRLVGRLLRAFATLHRSEALLLRAEGALFTHLKNERCKRLGFVQASDVCRELLQVPDRTARERVALHRALGRNRKLERLFMKGKLTNCQVLAIAPMLDGPDADRWIERARRVTVRRLKEEVRNKKPGIDHPERHSRRRITLDVPVEVAATLREYIEVGRKVIGYDCPPGEVVEAILAENGRSGLGDVAALPKRHRRSRRRRTAARLRHPIALVSPDDMAEAERLIERAQYFKDQVARTMNASKVLERFVPPADVLATDGRRTGWPAVEGRLARSAPAPTALPTTLPTPLPAAPPTTPPTASPTPRPTVPPTPPPTMPTTPPTPLPTTPSTTPPTTSPTPRPTVPPTPPPTMPMPLPTALPTSLPTPFESFDALLEHIRGLHHPLRVLQTQLIRAMLRTRCDRHLGYATSEDFVADRLRISPRVAREMVSESEMFERQPALEAAFLAGRIGVTKAHLIRMVALDGDLGRWIDRAEHVLVRPFERECRLVHLLRRYDPRIARRFQGPLPQPGMIEGLSEEVCSKHGLSPAALERELRRRGVAPLPPDSVFRDERGNPIPAVDALDPAKNPPLLRRLEVLVLLLCTSTSEDDAPARKRQMFAVSEPHTLFAFGCSDEVAADFSAMNRAFEDAHGPLIQRWIPFSLAALHAADTWTLPDPEREAARLKILTRDEHHCTFPGCGKRGTLEVNHARPRSLGGSDDPTNLHGMCFGHHRDVFHAGHARIHGAAPHNLTFEIGIRPVDGRPLMITSGNYVIERP